MKIKFYLIAGLLASVTSLEAMEIEIDNQTPYGTGKVIGLYSKGPKVEPLAINSSLYYRTKTSIKENAKTRIVFPNSEHEKPGNQIFLEVVLTATEEPNFLNSGISFGRPLTYGMGAGEGVIEEWNGKPIIITITPTDDWRTNRIKITNPD